MKKIVAYGEIMMRLTPQNFESLEDCNKLDLCYGGTESNVLVALSHLGDKTSFVTKLPDNQLGEAVTRHLLRHQVGVEDIVYGGSMLGIYFMEQGFASRPSSVIYHRKSSVINTLTEDDFDYDKVFDGASWFHVTGISLAISEASKNVAIRLCKEAKKRNLVVSFDFNYRATLWSLDEAKLVYKDIMEYVDVCFGNAFDLDNFMSIKETTELNSIKRFLNEYNVKYLIHTKRDIIDANTQSLSGHLYSNNNDIHTDIRSFEVLDRIGGGDAFVAGVIHILNKDIENVEEALSLGIDLGILKHLVSGDVLALSGREINKWLNNKKKDVIR
jgi:2-dehydro-3-deoxygluconokinase